MSNWVGVSPPVLAADRSSQSFVNGIPFPSTIEPTTLVPDPFVLPAPAEQPVTPANQALLPTALQTNGSCQNAFEAIRSKIIPFLKALGWTINVQSKLIQTLANQDLVIDHKIKQTQDVLIQTSQTVGASNQLTTHDNYQTASNLQNWTNQIQSNYSTLTTNLNQTSSSINSSLSSSSLPVTNLEYNQLMTQYGAWRQKSFLSKVPS